MDKLILTYANSIIDPGSFLTEVIQFISKTDIFKGVFVIMLFWGLWFRKEVTQEERSRLATILIIAITAIFIGRLLALTLPFRLRPIHHDGLGLNIAVDTLHLEGWSSMPSDHAVLFFALATGLFQVHRVVGALALLHAALIISLPRVVLGLHWPTDILVGAVVGVIISLALSSVLLRWHMWRIAFARAQDFPALFYPVFFFITFQAASMFDSARVLVRALGRALTHHLIGGP